MIISGLIKAQTINYDFGINYNPRVKQYWNIYNRVYLGNNYQPNTDTLNKCLLQMFSLIEPFNEDIALLSWTFHEKKQYSNATKYYYLALSKGYLSYCKSTQPHYILNNTAISEYRPINLHFDSFKRHVNCDLNIPFCNLVLELFAIDQITRNKDFFRKDSIMHADSGFYNRYLLFYDRQNLKRLLEYIDQFGIPHKNQLTNESYDAFKLLAHHLVQYIDNNESKRLFNLIKHAIEDGRLNNRFLTAAIDYMHWRNNCQYFGTVSQMNKDGKYELNPPLVDPANVDKRRAEWLLEPLEVQMRNNYDSNYVLPPEYIKLKK
jgi:hypothetical protein